MNEEDLVWPRSLRRHAQPGDRVEALAARELSLDEVLVNLSVTREPNGEFARREITLRRLVEMVADEVERRAIETAARGRK